MWIYTKVVTFAVLYVIRHLTYNVFTHEMSEQMVSIVILSGNYFFGASLLCFHYSTNFSVCIFIILFCWNAQTCTYTAIKTCIYLCNKVLLIVDDSDGISWTVLSLRWTHTYVPHNSHTCWHRICFL